MTIDPRHLHVAGTDHVGFPTPSETFLAPPSAKRREVLGEAHDG